MTKRDEFLKQVYSDKALEKILPELSEDERKRLDSDVESFVDGFVLPIVRQFEALRDSPELLELFRKELTRPKKTVIK